LPEFPGLPWQAATRRLRHVLANPRACRVASLNFRLRFGNGADDHCPLPSPDGPPGLACDHPEAGAWDL